MISVDVVKKQGDFLLEASFSGIGGITALFGPSGSGKSTVIRLVAGLARPDSGRIALGDRVLSDRAAGIELPAHRRRVGVVFQDSLLFPHLSVRHNLGYGRMFTPKAERRIAAGPVIDTLGIGHLLDRRPATLSGGERQRVAIGRALLSSPRLLLMDEPLAALDWNRRQEILPLIERLRDDFSIPILYVSHAVEEVARLADHVVVFDHGRVARAGTPAEVLHQGLNGDRFSVASVIEGRLGAPDRAFELTPVVHPAGRLWLTGIVGPEGRAVRVVVHATDISIATELPTGISIRTVLKARVRGLEGNDPAAIGLDLALKGGGRLTASVTRRSVADLGLEPGREVFALVKSVAIDERPV